MLLAASHYHISYRPLSSYSIVNLSMSYCFCSHTFYCLIICSHDIPITYVKFEDGQILAIPESVVWVVRYTIICVLFDNLIITLRPWLKIEFLLSLFARFLSVKFHTALSYFCLDGFCSPTFSLRIIGIFIYVSHAKIL